MIDDDQGTAESVVNIERIPAGGGEAELVIEDAEQISFSADGSRMTYLHVDRETLQRTLMVANADGTEPMVSLPDTAFLDLANPRLSPDGGNLALMHQGGLFVTGEAEPTLLVETPDHGGIDWAKITP